MLKSTLKSRKAAMRMMRELPGFVAFLVDCRATVVMSDTHDCNDETLGITAIYANEMYARSARLDLEREGVKIANTIKTTHTTPAQNLRAATIAYSHTPCASHFVGLELAMRVYQASFYKEMGQ
jgi:hypothetical protein